MEGRNQVHFTGMLVSIGDFTNNYIAQHYQESRQHENLPNDSYIDGDGGIFEFSDGVSYEGAVEEGLPNVRGIIYFENGNGSSMSGYWKNGSLDTNHVQIPDTNHQHRGQHAPRAADATSRYTAEDLWAGAATVEQQEAEEAWKDAYAAAEDEIENAFERFFFLIV